MNFRVIPAALLAVAACLLAGCAMYHLGPAKPSYLKDVHTLAVPVFRNNTLLPRIESVITDTVSEQIQQDGTFAIAGKDAADAVLMCTIERVTRTPFRSVTGNVLLTSEFELNLELRYQLYERVGGRVLDGGRVSGSTTFFVGSDVEQDERQAIPIAAQQLAVRLVSEVAEGF